MFRTITLIALFILSLAAVAAAQDFGPGQASGVCGFVDENGDGFNDLAPDADGDGIPNGQDPDYVKPEDGTGGQFKHQYGKLVDAEQAAQFGAMIGAARGALLMNAYKHAYKGEGAGNGESGSAFAWGPGDGSGLGTGPADGTGFGPGDGTGDCDGSGTPAEAIQARRGGRR